MVVFSFVKELIETQSELHGRDWLGTVDEGIEHFRDVDRFIQSTGPNETIVFDVVGLKLFGYSYAKQTIRRVLLSGIRGEYDQRSFLLVAPSKKFCAELEKALTEEKLVMIGSVKLGREFYNHYFLLGVEKPKLVETLELVLKAKETMTNEVARKLGTSLQDASNWLRKLSDMNLIIRERPVDRAGHVYTYKRIEAT